MRLQDLSCKMAVSPHGLKQCKIEVAFVFGEKLADTGITNKQFVELWHTSVRQLAGSALDRLARRCRVRALAPKQQPRERLRRHFLGRFCVFSNIGVGGAILMYPVFFVAGHGSGDTGQCALRLMAAETALATASRRCGPRVAHWKNSAHICNVWATQCRLHKSKCDLASSDWILAARAAKRADCAALRASVFRWPFSWSALAFWILASSLRIARRWPFFSQHFAPQYARLFARAFSSAKTHDLLQTSPISSSANNEDGPQPSALWQCRRQL